MPNVRNSSKQPQYAFALSTPTTSLRNKNTSESDPSYISAQAVSKTVTPSRGKKPRSTPASLAGRIPRPSNAFMLYRSFVHSSGMLDAELHLHQNQLSSTAAAMWNAMTEQGKEPWYERARIEKQEHARKYPDFWMSKKGSQRGSSSRNGGSCARLGRNANVEQPTLPTATGGAGSVSRTAQPSADNGGPYSPITFSPPTPASTASSASHESFESEDFELAPFLAASDHSILVTPSPFSPSSALDHSAWTLLSELSISNVSPTGSDAVLQSAATYTKASEDPFDLMYSDGRTINVGDGIDQPWHWAAEILEQRVYL